MGGILSWLAAILLAGGGALGILSLGGGLARESRRRMLPRLAAAAGAALLLLTGASLIVRWLAGTGGREPFGFFPALFAAAGILAVLLARGRKGQAASCARLCRDGCARRLCAGNLSVQWERLSAPAARPLPASPPPRPGAAGGGRPPAGGRPPFRLRRGNGHLAGARHAGRLCRFSNGWPVGPADGRRLSTGRR